MDKRMNLATGKKTRSFLRQDGSPKFIEKHCEFCNKLGKKDQWHFGFEYTARQMVHTAWIETIETDSEEDLPGVCWTPHMVSYTSHVFASVSEDESDSGKE